MAYPDDKETWAVRETDDLIPASDHNDWATFLEALQDTLGLGIKLGYDSVKLLLDYLKGKADIVDDKVDKAGDTMTDNLTLKKDGIQFALQNADESDFLGIILETWGVNIATNLNRYSFRGHDGADFFNIMQIYGDRIESEFDIEIMDKTKGIIMTTPDETKRYRITIDNSGNLVTTQV